MAGRPNVSGKHLFLDCGAGPPRGVSGRTGGRFEGGGVPNQSEQTAGVLFPTNQASRAAARGFRADARRATFQRFRRSDPPGFLFPEPNQAQWVFPVLLVLMFAGFWFFGSPGESIPGRGRYALVMSLLMVGWRYVTVGGPGIAVTNSKKGRKMKKTRTHAVGLAADGCGG